MSNPYTPPSTREDSSTDVSNKDTLLRRIGALAIAYLLVTTMWRLFPDFQNMLLGAVIMGLYIYGFLQGGRKFHFSIALLITLTIAVQAFFVSRAAAHQKQVMFDPGPRLWEEFIVGLIPFIIALICATALYIRARRTAPITA